MIAGAARKGVALHACWPMCERCSTPEGVVHCSSKEQQAAAAAGEAAALAAHQHSSRGLLLAFNSSAGPSATSGAAAAHAEALAWHWQGSAVQGGAAPAAGCDCSGILPQMRRLVASTLAALLSACRQRCLCYDGHVIQRVQRSLYAR